MSEGSEIFDQNSSINSLNSQLSSEQRQLDEKQLEDLQQSRLRMIQFINTLNQIAETPIKDSLFRFCGKYKGFHMAPNNVLNLLEKRIERMLKNKKRKKNWNSQDSKILIWTTSKYMECHNIQNIDSLRLQDWKNISSLIPGSLPEGCMFKILNYKKTKLSSKKWTHEQSTLLSELALKNDKKNWRRISQKLYILNEKSNKIFRNAKQCKQHWNCFLNPELKKGTWDTSEDKALFQYVLNNQGQKKWSNLTKVIKGRTENALKNRYNVILEREGRKNHSTDELVIVSNYLKKLNVGQNKSMYINRKKSQRRDKNDDTKKTEQSCKTQEKQKQMLDQQVQEKKEERKLKNEKIEEPPMNAEMQGFPATNAYLCPVLFQNTNYFFIVPQSFM